MQVKILENQEIKKFKKNLKPPRQQELVKIRAGINEVETWKAIQRINKPLRWFCYINKITSPLSN